MLLDAQGREIVRVKQFGFVRVALEYAVVPSAAPPSAEAIATATVAPEEE